MEFRLRALLIVLLVYQHTWPIMAGADIEPPFPLLFSQSQIKQHRFHIVTESISETSGYETHEEFLDTEAAKSTLIVSDKNGRSITHIDANIDVVFRYKPYTCVALKPAEVEHSGNEGLWHKEINLGPAGRDGPEPRLLIYGVAAVWLNAGDLPKTYSNTELVYSASKDIHKQAHKWTVMDQDTESNVHLYFIENKSSARDSKMSLEMIQIESIKAKKIIRTVNVLSFEYSIDEEVYDSLMQIPVGYGCVDQQIANDRKKADEPWQSISEIYLSPFLEGSYKLDLEVTASKFDETTQKRSSDTINLELANDIKQKLTLIRQRDTKRDIKTIMNHVFLVQYLIDLRRGTCKMSNEDKNREKSDYAKLTFQNGVEFDLNSETLVKLFTSTDSYRFIKKTKAKQGPRDLEYLYYEAEISKSDYFSRVVRVYTSSSGSRTSGNTKLESVTVLIFNTADTSKMSQSIHFNVIEARPIEGSLDTCRTFDISEECYLNNEKMKQGRDYTWFELTYPMSSHHSEIIASRSMEFKQMVHDRFVDAGLSLFQAPRMELIFDTSLIIRVLLLDIPSLTYIYYLKTDSILEGYDKSEITVDVDHCADLCRLYKCRTMSFSESEHSCLISVGYPDQKYRFINAKKGWQTYTRPTISFDFDSMIVNQRLNHLISELQHRNYDPIPLPKMPDELVYPRSQTGVDDATFREITDSYLNDVAKFMEDSGQEVPELTLNLTIDDNLLILMPSQFEVEQDPLSEFSLTKDDLSSDGDLQEQSAPTFHEGLNLHAYKIDLMGQVNQKNWRLFNGLNYDQCALACIDGKCSSFSYCTHRQECIITDVYSLSDSLSQNSVKPDLDCFIVQRDFLSKFNKFRDVYRPNVYKRTTSAINPSECAHSCMVESEFNCLAFDYCQPNQVEGRDSQTGTCFYLDERRIYTGAQSTDTSNSTSDKKPASKPIETGCDHYSRSYLADFLRIEYRKIDDNELMKMKTSELEGRSVDQCADMCVNELFDCTAFQFCFDPTAEGVKQKCIMIESQPKVDDSSDSQVVLDYSKDGQVVKAGKLFAASDICHVFSLRRGSNEAFRRDLALNSMTEEEYEAIQKAKEVGGGLSIGGGILLYFSLTLVFAVIGCGIVMAKQHNEYVRQKIERAQLLLGINII